jgi:uncharacterized protein (DUF305 family)
VNSKKIGMAILMTVAAIVLAACGGGGDSGQGGHAGMTGMTSATSAPVAAADRNDADIAFAQKMIQHHAQAIEMAKLAPQRAASAEVKDLAARVEKAQQPEIETMTAWLRSWGAMVPTGDMAGHGMEPGSGMMTAEQMQQLTQATGRDFDRLWLQMMTAHHEGAVEQARTELAQGKNADAKKLAQTIIDTQQAEINEMKALLARA